MSARTDRIAKLTTLITDLAARGNLPKAQWMQDKKDAFAAMSDERYDELMIKYATKQEG